MDKKKFFLSWQQTVSSIIGGFLGAGCLLLLGFFVWKYGLFSLSFFVSETTQVPKQVQVTTMDVADIVEKINPAVVSILITKNVPVIEQYYDDPFSDFFGGNSPFQFRFRVPRYRQNGTQQQEVGGGSGFFVSEDGYVVTNAHVVSEEGAEYTVFTNDGQKYSAQVIATDTLLDIAVLKIEGNGFSFLTFGNSDELRLGQAVIAIGNALGEYRNTVSTGVISGLARSITAGDLAGMSEVLENVIQTDAAINLGNSGGPLLNLEGEVIGVNVAMIANSENIGFSLPSNAVKISVDSIIQQGKVVRPYLGVRYLMVNETLQEKNNLPNDYGALILRGENAEDLAVIPGSPADKAGLEEYDVILQVDGQKVDIDHPLAGLIRQYNVGDVITLSIVHDGNEKTVQVTLEESP